MTDLKQLAEDSFKSTLRRIGIFTKEYQLCKIIEEIKELESAVSDSEFNKSYLSRHCKELTRTAEELADVILACLVFAERENIDIEKALRIKNEFNKIRK